MKPRALLNLRRNLDKARASLARRNPALAAEAIVAAARQGPLAVRPTRMLWQLAARCLLRGPELRDSLLHVLFDSTGARASILEGNDCRNRRLFRPALECYTDALAHSPLAPEALYKTGACHFDLGDWDAAAHWLRLVPAVAPPSARTDRYLTHFVADSLFRLARIERGKRHLLRSRRFALAALLVNPEFSAAASLADAGARHPPAEPSTSRLPGDLPPPRCLICATSLVAPSGEPLVLCVRCSTPLHAPCWAFARRCPIRSCQSVDHQELPLARE